MKAFIFAAGKGTRLKPFTDFHPKALAMVNNKTLLERNILYLKSFGIQDFIINIHHFGQQIIDFLKANNNFGVNIEISNETNQLLETGGALLHAKHLFENEKHLLIVNADILTNMNLDSLIETHIKNKHYATIAVSNRNSSRKLLFDKNNRLQGWKNTATNEQILGNDTKNLAEFAFSGIHCICTDFVKNFTHTGKFSIINEYLAQMNTQNIYGFVHNADLIDVGKPENIALAEILFE